MEDWNDWATTNEFFCHPLRLTRPLFAFQIIPILSFFVRDVYSWCKERELSRIATTKMQSKRSIVTIERQHIIILWKHTRMSTTSNPKESRMVGKNAYRETQKGVLALLLLVAGGAAKPNKIVWWYTIIREMEKPRHAGLNLLKLAKRNGDGTTADWSSSSRPNKNQLIWEWRWGSWVAMTRLCSYPAYLKWK